MGEARVNRQWILKQRPAGKVTEECFEWRESEVLSGRAPELGIVEDRRFGEVPQDEGFAGLPLILISCRGGPPVEDRRLVGAIPRPAGPT